MDEMQRLFGDEYAPDNPLHVLFMTFARGLSEMIKVAAERRQLSLRLCEELRILVAKEVSAAHGIRAFKEKNAVPQLLEAEEVVRFLEEVPPHFHALVACAVYAGLRRSELFYLRWEDILIFPHKDGQV
jgi:integrase